MKNLTQEQQSHALGLIATYEKANANLEAKLNQLKTLEEKLATIDKAINATEVEKNHIRNENKRLAMALNTDTKPLKTNQAKHRTACEILEDYKELHNEVNQSVRAAEIEVILAQRDLIHSREISLSHIGSMLFEEALAELATTPALGILSIAMRMKSLAHAGSEYSMAMKNVSDIAINKNYMDELTDKFAKILTATTPENIIEIDSITHPVNVFNIKPFVSVGVMELAQMRKELGTLQQ